MPLSKLQNFIKNTEGKILYVNPNDIGATDSIENQGNSLSQPFKTIQRALIESARFSYVRGNDNDLFDRTTILLFPGEHFIDNRPGFKIRDDGGVAKAISPSGVETLAQSTLTLSLESVFDLDVEDNILYKLNSVNGGCILPRGTAIVGLDLRKTKIRPLYVPNPTDDDVPKTELIRLTGTCYFRDFTFFDGLETGRVYTDKADFSASNKSKPSFSHHKLTCFGFADGVNEIDGTGLTDLDMYYSKLSNAFNESSGRNIDQKFPAEPLGFSKSRIEYEIVGAFASDPVPVASIISGDGATPSALVTVTTNQPHEFTVGTPIKMRGVTPSDYNISTFVQSVPSATKFTYLLPFVSPTLPAQGVVAGATATIETDTVTGASPYVFNCSLRSVFGMNGMLADGKNATGFRSMVVAQFTAVSLQKDDRAFVKYNPVSRTYDGIPIVKVTGGQLASESSSTNSNTVYHLDSRAVYRRGWETTHVKMKNDSIIQLVSVFAIGFNAHFRCESGGDASITNSNSNFGQIALISEGFKKEAFAKDDQGYVTSIVAPQTIDETVSRKIDLVTLDVGLTTQVGVSSHLYLFGFTDKDNPPQILTQGFRIGAKKDDQLFVDINGTTYKAPILISDNLVSAAQTITTGEGTKEKVTPITNVNANSEFSTLVPHDLKTTEKIRIYSETGDLPENLQEDTVYFAIVKTSLEFKVATSISDALKGEGIVVYGGTGLRVESRVSDKAAGEIGCPVLFDPNQNNWFIHVQRDNEIFGAFDSQGGVIGIGAQTPESYIRRTPDNRSLSDKIYKVRYFIPKESSLGRNPVENFSLQDSNNTKFRTDQDFTIESIDLSDFDFGRNTRYIATATASGSTVTLRVEAPHNVQVGDRVQIIDATSTTNTAGAAKSGYNGEFVVTGVPNEMEFQYGFTDTDGETRLPGNFTSDTDKRLALNPRYQRTNNQNNAIVYRSEVIQEHIPGISDGIYHFNVLAANNTISEEFTDRSFLPQIEKFFPQLDRDNPDTNPPAAKSFAKRSPIGDVAVDDPENSITRESVDSFSKTLGLGRTVIESVRNDVVGIATVTLDRPHNLAGLVTYTTLNQGSGYTEGDYYNRKLTNQGSGDWDGATARIIVGSGGAVESVEIQAPGSGYSDGETLEIDGFPGASIVISSSGISTVVHNSIQLTGIGSTASGTFRITGIPATNKVAYALTEGDPFPVKGQYLVNVGRSRGISTTIYNAQVGIATITFNEAHGLISGSPFQIVDTSNNNVGAFNVLERVGINTITFRATEVEGTALQTNPDLVLPQSFAARGGTIDRDGENLGARSFNFFDNETGILGEDIGDGETDVKVKISLPNSGVGTAQRFDIGSYIEIDGEVMRIVSRTLSGSGNDELTVIRGYIGSDAAAHKQGALIRKINIYGTELRRPSILRASGHTFEYLGYGPGNYSTGLPQVQNITLTDKEEFLTQSQQHNGGVVVYTAMNNDGDFFIGNKIINPSTGEETTFNAPIPSIRGEDPSVLSVIFDEVIVKERLVVEGGASKTLLSQFDGPLTVNNVMNINDNTKIDGNLEVTGRLDTSGSLDVTGFLNVSGISTFSGQAEFESGLETGDFEIGIGASIGKINTKTENFYIQPATGLTINDGDLAVDGVLSADFLTVPNVPPVGGVMMWAGGTAGSFPVGLSTYWAICDGRTLNQSEYPLLYNVLTFNGTEFPWGNNPSGSTFVIPDLRDKFMIAAGNQYTRTSIGGTTDAVTIVHTHNTTTASEPDHNHSNAQAGSHNHSADNEPNHNHQQTDPNGGHAHTIVQNGSHNHGQTDNAGGHLHETNPVGNHGHGQVDSGGSHGHNANNGGSHGHNTSGNGGHNHSTSSGGSHNHSYQRPDGTAERGNRNSRVRNVDFGTVSVGGGGNHGHNINPVGNHNHGVNPGGNHGHGVNPGGSHQHETNPGGGHNHGQTDNAPAHQHEVNPAGTHAHNSQPAGGHVHETNPGGSHNHGLDNEPNHVHTISENGGHNHTVQNDPSGVGGGELNMPPYQGIFYIIRLA